ncbi:MAG: FKBP-type peptidyl-prolyl cis-trans isomerase [Alphaproteobacteria bacterium]|nr:FKBP-type peptidyl-prolyl cis-trans isomerase [Alphaproteobacteria bacterium]
MSLTDEANAAFLAGYDAQPGVSKTASGLRYKVVSEGAAGGKQPGARSNVTVHYKGTFIDGREFDSSYKRNAPATFGLHQVISGWTEGVQLMKEGDTFEFAIPFDLAYGERGGGSIPPRQTLVFQVELLKVA